jgi:hypothetical protein
MAGSSRHHWFADAAQDLRFAWRALRKHSGFSSLAIATLALGIGANTAIFTLFDAILLRSLPVPDPSRLVLFDDGVGQGTSAGDVPTGRWTLFSMEVYRDLRDQPLGFASLAAVRSGEAAVLARRRRRPARPRRSARRRTSFPGTTSRRLECARRLAAC